AERPLILVGNGAIRARASEAITALVDQLHIPVTNTFMGKGVIPYKHPLALWTVGLQQRDFISCAIDKSDLVIAVGYDLVEYPPKKWNPDGKIPIVHVGTRPAEIDSSYIPQVEVIGDIADSLREILQRVERKPQSSYPFQAIRDEMRADYEQYRGDTAFPIKPQKLLYDLRQVMGPEDIVLSDVGAHKMWIARNYHCERPNTCLISNGFASMGIAIPGAIAAKLVNPERKIVAVTGDGGFMMNCQELETALRLGTPFVTVIVNDGGYGLIEWKQHNYYGESAFIKFNNPDFVALAQSFGLKGYRIQTTEDFIPTLKMALADDVPAIIDCPIDYGENLLFTEKSKELACKI
ncbi:MAG: acetolactate synthase large subunit, partial [Cyanobacteria bacterium J06642_11]